MGSQGSDFKSRTPFSSPLVKTNNPPLCLWKLYLRLTAHEMSMYSVPSMEEDIEKVLSLLPGSSQYDLCAVIIVDIRVGCTLRGEGSQLTVGSKSLG